jgi:hypothetical protein
VGWLVASTDKTPPNKREADTGVGPGQEAELDVVPSSVSSASDKTPLEAWYHADFCHAFAWVYENGDKLRVRWGERTGSNLYLHSKSDCNRCREIRKDERVARDGEFTMEKPPAEFSSGESFFRVLAEIGRYVPGLCEEESEVG